MLNKLHFEILSKEQLEIINRISEINKNFLLVGGTAISLQIGHRQSIDFDFFSDKEFDMDSLKNDLRKYISFDKVLIDKINEFTFISNNVKLTYLYYPFKITENIIQTEYNINIPD
ncbi:nucleotidyl transferase AbiEii/AbiGii toxin family protein, partial [bacterium]|nr:nucleotidyl transferase AbiEii/AbiGii toxin family protein [bacterium]